MKIGRPKYNSDEGLQEIASKHPTDERGDKFRPVVVVVAIRFAVTVDTRSVIVVILIVVIVVIVIIVVLEFSNIIVAIKPNSLVQAAAVGNHPVDMVAAGVAVDVTRTM